MEIIPKKVIAFEIYLIVSADSYVGSNRNTVIPFKNTHEDSRVMMDVWVLNSNGQRGSV